MSTEDSAMKLVINFFLILLFTFCQAENRESTDAEEYYIRPYFECEKMASFFVVECNEHLVNYQDEDFKKLNNYKLASFSSYTNTFEFTIASCGEKENESIIRSIFKQCKISKSTKETPPRNYLREKLINPSLEDRFLNY